ncbi:fatty acid amide hydrolase [Haematococcus lacustris]
MFAHMHIKELPPADKLPQPQPYNMKLLKAPVLSGLALTAFITMMESPMGATIYSAVGPQSGITQVLQGVKVPEAPLFRPLLPAPDAVPEPGCAVLRADTAAEAAVALTRDGFLQRISDALGVVTTEPVTAGVATAAYRRPCVADYVKAYRTGVTTPVEVAERIIAFVAEQPGPWFVSWLPEDVRLQAQESSRRLAEGQPRSFLEGVPFAVKDVMDAAPHPTSCGTVFLAEQRPPGPDAPYITSLKAMGAILLGKTCLHEVGLGITGLNLRTGTPRNPYHPGHFCGGSSSGSAAVLAAGLCPLAIGTDGGGSIRIPSSFCGVTGLKPTNGRVSRAGCVEVDCSVSTLGPMAGCVEDVALLHALIANWDTEPLPPGPALPPLQLPLPLPLVSPPPPQDPPTSQPSQGAPSLLGCRAGVYWEWFNDADPEVVAACKAALQLLQDEGVAVKEVVLPELEMLRVAHTVTIVTEMHHNLQAQWRDYTCRARFNADVRLSLDTARFFTAADYVHCQRIRRRATHHFRAAMQDVDVLVTPSTPCTAPPIPVGALTGGNSNLGQTSLVMRFVHQANLLGLPAISLPVGRDAKGLPIGLQLIGKPWQEGTLLRWAAALERRLQPKLPGPEAFGGVAGAPRLWVDPLTAARSDAA